MSFDVGQTVWITGRNWPTPKRTTISEVHKKTVRVADYVTLVFDLHNGYEVTAGGRDCRIVSTDPTPKEADNFPPWPPDVVADVGRILRKGYERALADAEADGAGPSATPTSPVIYRLLDMSTKHLPEKVCQNLNDYPGVVADDRKYGWFVWVPEDIDAHLAEYNDVQDPEELPPTELVTIWRYAQTNNCQYVLLDRDADENPDLPTWEW